MAKNWVVYNAQGRIVTRLAGTSAGPESMPVHLQAAAKAGMLTCQYRPRAKSTKRTFPYVGDNKL